MASSRDAGASGAATDPERVPEAGEGVKPCPACLDSGVVREGATIPASAGFCACPHGREKERAMARMGALMKANQLAYEHRVERNPMLNTHPLSGAPSHSGADLLNALEELGWTLTRGETE